MATTTISTDKWIESANPSVSVRTDRWLADLGAAETVTLSTDLWALYLTAGALPIYNPSLITSILRAYQNLPFPQFIIAGQGTGSLYRLFKKTTTQNFTVWRSPVYQIGKEFDVLGISLNLLQDLSAGMSIIPKLYFDNERDSSVGTTITSNNYSGKLIIQNSKNFGNKTHGKHNFFLELQFTGSVLQIVSLPIFIEIDEYDT